MNDFKLQGTGVALVTPFDEKGLVDTAALRRLVRHVVAGGVDFLVALGTTAETPTLSDDEKTRVVSIILEEAGGLPVVLGLGGNNTAQIVEELRNLDATGLSAILSVVPPYNKPTQRGMLAHFKAIADASPLPVILYNIPGRSGVNMLPATTLELALHPNIIGVKEASGSIPQIVEIIERAPKGFKVVSGDDSITLDIMRKGASGVISVVANAFPGQMARLTSHALKGEYKDAQDADDFLKPFYKPLFADGNPAGIKSLLNLMGLAGDVLRLPLVSVSKETRENLNKLL